MALPSSGVITMAQVSAELGISATGLSLNDSRVRALAGRASGAISMSDLRGKSVGTVLTLTVGTHTDKYGTAYGMSSTGVNNYGALSPKTLEGRNIIVAYAGGILGSGFVFSLAGTTVGSLSKYTRFQLDSQPVRTLTWTGGEENTLGSAAGDSATYLSTKVGKTVKVTLS